MLVIGCILLVVGVQAQIPPFGKIAYGSMESQLLNEDREYAVYLPASYESSPDKYYPVLYLLHGGGGSHKDWPIQGNLAAVANVLIASREATEMIIVCPEAGKTFMNYFNSAEWPFEDHFFQELIPHIESTYRTKEGKAYRAISGLSMGGGGSMAYAIRHPEMFGATYAMSGYFYRQEELFWINFDDPVQKKIHGLVEENNVVRLIQEADEQQLAALKQVNWFIDCGDDDFTFKPNVELVLALKLAGIPHEFRVKNGGHTWEYWHGALYTALPYISTIFRIADSEPDD